MALSGTTIPGMTGPASNGNEGVLCIPQSSNITGTLPSDCLVSYQGLSLGVEVLFLCREAFVVFYNYFCVIRINTAFSEYGRIVDDNMCVCVCVSVWGVQIA